MLEAIKPSGRADKEFRLASRITYSVFWEENSGPVNSERVVHLSRSKLIGQGAVPNGLPYSSNRLALHR